MRRLDRKALDELAGILASVFYAFMAVSLLAAFAAAPSAALRLLILGGCAHVARVGVEELALIRAAV